MAATVLINEWNGTSGSQAATDKTSGTIRYKKADSAAVDNNNSLMKPASGQFDRSFHKYHRLRIGGTGPAGDIRNVKAYFTGTFGTGTKVYGRNIAAYATPAQADGTGEGTTYSDASAWTSASPLSLGAGPYTGTNVDIGDFINTYMRIADTVMAWDATANAGAGGEVAPPGPTRPITLTVAWDET